jgi:integrase
MPRRLRSATIENRTARLALPRRRAPHGLANVAPGIRLGYRRTKSAGTWVLRAADGQGGEWQARIGIADDYEPADGEHVLTFWQAADKARAMVRGTSNSAPITFTMALDTYERNLIARGGSVANAGRIRKHLTPSLAAKPVALLTARELSAWRDQLLADGMKTATVVRLCKVAKAALNLAARHDARITNRAAWGDGLSGIAEGFASRNVQRLDDEQVRTLIAAAYAVDTAFGLYVEVAAVTGARLSQIARLAVADLQGDSTPRLMMPASRKGRSRKPAKRPVPITEGLAAKLESNRPADAPLLLRSDGAAWQSSHDGDHERFYRLAAECAGISGTIYALRHSSIIRSLLANVPARVVAATHDTSIVMLERTYSAYIADHADAVARRGLLDLAQPADMVNSPGRP